MDMDKLRLRLQALVIFRGLLQDEVVQKLYALLSIGGVSPDEQVSRYADFAAALFAHGGNLTDYVWRRVVEDDNFYIRHHGRSASDELEACLSHELRTLEDISSLTADQIKAQMDDHGYLPAWQTGMMNFASAYARHIENIANEGFGVFVSSHMLRATGKTVIPVKYPDPVRLSDLKGYDRQKKAVTDNTLALLNGRPAANALLYGDAGTGKSSTVKAIANEYAPRGLRLIEIPKRRFRSIPALVETLSAYPLKFILFIDDLSFIQPGDDFNALKAALEGSVSAKARNIVIYATSNRRHMVKELFSDRDGDDIHRSETIQELCSLSHRFGLTVGYFKPDKKAYLDIVHALKDEYGIQMDDVSLDLEAERFASAGRSPRAARQFIDMLRRKI